MVYESLDLPKLEMTQCDSSAGSENVDHHPIAIHVPLDSPSIEPPPAPISERSLSLGPAKTKSSRSTRLSYREKKERFRASLGIGKAASMAAARGGKLSEEILTKSTFHYFWFSRFWLQIYCTLLVSILSREPAVLHLITIFILWHMLKRAIAWGAFFARGGEAKKGIARIRWMLKFSLGFLEKALEGNKVHGFLTAKTFVFWTGTGKNFLVAFFRHQLRDIRTGTLQDVREMLRRQDMVRQKQQKKLLSLFGVD